MADKRKLPVLQDTESDDADARPPYQWIGFGAGAILVAWLPLAAIAQSVALRVASAWLGPVGSDQDAAAALAELDPSARARVSLAFLLFPALGLGVAALAGGFLVGRWGGAAGVREAALAGTLAVAIVTVLSFARGGIAWTPIVALGLATGAAALGGRLGRRRRPKA